MRELTLQQKWDDAYRDGLVGAAARVLVENAHLLPQHGVALDFACGLGANALFLGQRGLEVHAYDVSSVAVAKLAAAAAERGVRVSGHVADLTEYPLSPASFDVIVVAHFLDRELFPGLLAALRPGGVLFYQTFSRARIDDTGPRNEAFRLGDNELLNLCASLRVLVYREEGSVGDTARGFRNLAMIVAQKR
jgi:SAM-dependent methyltransferase